MSFGTAEMNQRLVNAVTFPYFLAAMLAVCTEALTWTPLWAVIVALAHRAKAHIKAKFQSGKVGVEREGDHHMPSYSLAVNTNRFGASPKDYDLTKIGRYEETLALGDNLEVFRKINLHVPLGGANARAFTDRIKKNQSGEGEDPKGGGKPTARDPLPPIKK